MKKEINLESEYFDVIFRVAERAFSAVNHLETWFKEAKLELSSTYRARPQIDWAVLVFYNGYQMMFRNISDKGDVKDYSEALIIADERAKSALADKKKGFAIDISMSIGVGGLGSEENQLMELIIILELSKLEMFSRYNLTGKNSHYHQTLKESNNYYLNKCYLDFILTKSRRILDELYR